MIGTVRFAAGVIITGTPSPAQCRLIAALDTVARETGRDLTITCGEEGHPPTDPHTRRQAFDVRVRDLEAPDIVDVYKQLATELGTRWTVLCEAPTLPDDPVLRDIIYVNAGASAMHIHLQPVKGSDYPPIPQQP